MASWAVVIGIDRYWSQAACLKGAVRDALAVREWLVDPVGGDVPEENVRLLLAPAEASPPVAPELGAITATKANIIVAINDLIQLSGAKGERLYFYFAGHGLTTRVSNRDESAVLATDFTPVITDNSIALRSLWEYLETTQFEDQFLFVDACRDVPPWGDGAEFELGRWTLPRSRAPGLPPVQQFILYATSPKLKAAEVRDTPGAEHGAFTAALLDGLRGVGAAKAWSWQRQGYEVRWERLAEYVKRRVEAEKRAVMDTPTGPLLQIPQDTGSRGVADRERDAVLASFSAEAFAKERLEVLLDPDKAYRTADVRVLNGVGDVVAGQVGSTGQSVVFYLPPGTYALRAAEPEIGEGRATEPVELYEPLAQPPTIALRPIDEPPQADAPSAQPASSEPAAPAAPRSVESVRPGTIPIDAPDPLSIVEVTDEAGRAVRVGRLAEPRLELPPGMYQLRHIGPERTSRKRPIALAAGEHERLVELRAAEPSPATLELLEAMAGTQGAGHTLALPGREPMAWAQTSTLVAIALGNALDRKRGKASLGLRPRRAPDGSTLRTGIVVCVVSETGALDPSGLAIRVWETGDTIPADPEPLRKIRANLVELVAPREPGRYWVSLERAGEGRPLVFAVTVLHDRLATIVVQTTAGIRLLQHSPATDADAPRSDPRSVEYLERMLLSGRLDGARELALELAATSDPFVGCLCGYVLLRLGLFEELHDLTARLLEQGPKLSDAFVLLGEHADATGTTEAKQAFAEAVAAGVPVFAEGLTRLLEGLRAHDVVHPRAAVVRYVFQNHMRGSMWSVCTPRRFMPGTLLVTGADIGYEA